MKKILINSVLLFILIGIPLLPSYLEIYSIAIESNKSISLEFDSKEDLEVLKGDIAYLKAIFSRSNNDANNKGEPVSQRVNNSITQLVFTVPLKIEVFTPQIINNKALNFINTNLTPIYLKIPSPPPKLVS